jgi:phospholipid/cholesterol/gamma-HCH transport system ATP-binding protein
MADERPEEEREEQGVEGETDATLMEEVSADVAATVSEFMEQAAAQNEAAAEELPETKRNQPASYISFDQVSKDF